MKKILIILIVLITISLGFISCMRNNIDEFPIVSIIREKGFEGDFFLGCGSIGDITYYLSYIIFPDGKMKLIKIDIAKILIYEISKGEPYVKVNYYADHDINVEQRLRKGKYSWAWMTFYVPKGTILKKFKL